MAIFLSKLLVIIPELNGGFTRQWNQRVMENIGNGNEWRFESGIKILKGGGSNWDQMLGIPEMTILWCHQTCWKILELNGCF